MPGTAGTPASNLTAEPLLRTQCCVDIACMIPRTTGRQGWRRSIDLPQLEPPSVTTLTNSWLAATLVRRNVAETKVSSIPVGPVCHPSQSRQPWEIILSVMSCHVSAQKGGCAPSADARMGLPGGHGG